MNHTVLSKRFLLTANPFEPVASGAPLYGSLRLPETLENDTRTLFDLHGTGPGDKAIIVVGEYGRGKSCLLQWLHREYCREHQIRSFYFDNPGVHFYDLANALLRTLGRKEFAKSIWELVGPYLPVSGRRTLFDKDFEAYLTRLSQSRANQPQHTAALQNAVRSAGLSDDEEVAHCLARIVTDVVRKPYFEYRDFVPRASGSIVPEREEAPYFRALLRTIERASSARGIAFLIDEFEEIGLQKRLTRRAAHDYLATMKRLISVSRSDSLNFWIVLSMTPEAYEMTAELDPPLMQRVSEKKVDVVPLTRDDACALLRDRLNAVRSTEVPADNDLHPFRQDLGFSPRVLANPRRLIKACFFALARAGMDVKVPFELDYIRGIENALFPEEEDDQ